MKSISGKDMTMGSIPRHILNFGLPMSLGLLLTMGYSIINTIWIGNLLGKEAMGAAAVSFPITFILISIAAGSTTATSILISQNYGSRNLKRIEKVIGNSLSMFAGIAALLTVFSLIMRNPILKVMGTPAELMKMASSYLSISLLGFFLTYIYYIVNSVFSGMGDTKTPVIFLVLSTIVNAVLDPILIKAMGLNGAAVASLISGGSALIAAIIFLRRNKFIVGINLSSLKLEGKIILSIIKIGLPAVIQQCLLPISLIFITSFINSFGADAIAAYGAASKIDYLAAIPATAMGSAASIITGQNLGAGKTDRVREVFKWGIIINFSIIFTISIFVLAFPRTFLSIFARDPQVLSMGATYLKTIAAGYCIFSITFITNGIITGSGKTIITMFFSIISLFIIRIPLANYMSNTDLGLKGIWLAMLITYVITAVLSTTYYLSGRWKKLSQTQENNKVTTTLKIASEEE
jgi:putative MATE family efflux protein